MPQQRQIFAIIPAELRLKLLQQIGAPGQGDALFPQLGLVVKGLWVVIEARFIGEESSKGVAEIIWITHIERFVHGIEQDMHRLGHEWIDVVLLPLAAARGSSNQQEDAPI